MIRSILAIIMAFSLSACAGQKDYFQEAILKTSLANYFLKKQNPASNAMILTREQIAGIKVPLIQVIVPKADLNTYAIQSATNKGYATFDTTKGHSFTFYKGELVATRGLRYDLMARDLHDNNRYYRYLSATNGQEIVIKNCVIDRQVSDSVKIFDRHIPTILTEHICQKDDNGFKVRLWRDKAGKPVKAQQWIGYQMGFATIIWH